MDPSPIWTEIRCDADAVTKLINQGMDLTQRAIFYNETVLHHWAGGHYCCNIEMDGWSSLQEDSLKVVKILIEKGADLQALDNWGFTPLLYAANGSHYGKLPNLRVLDFLLGREEYSRAEKIEAMELAGAVILQTTKNASLYPKAFDYWRKTLHLRRRMEEGESGFIEKPRLNLKNVQTTEWRTSVELENVIEDPEKFMIQSFFVRLRIFSSKKWGAMNSFFDSAILRDYFRQNWRRVNKVIDIIWAMLETLLSRSDLHANEDAQRKLRHVQDKLIDAFSCCYRDSFKILTEEIIKTSLDLIISASGLSFLIQYRFAYLIRFVRILPHLPQFLLNKDVKETLSKMRDQYGRNLMHIAICGTSKSDVNLYATVRLLFYAGCDPNAIDQDGNAPLHFLAQLDQQFGFRHLDIAANLLLDFGAQLSIKNKVGKSAVDLLIQKNYERTRNMGQGIIGWKLPDWCTESPTLAILSARVVRRNRIPYLELPATLILMIEK